MRRLTRPELMAVLQHRKGIVDLREIILEDIDLAGADLSNVRFDWSDFLNVKLDQADLTGATFANTLFAGCSLEQAVLRQTDLTSADLRGCNLKLADICGANLYGAILDQAVLEGIRHDQDTRFFRMHCPEQGAFLGYKKCFNHRMVQLLIPAEARRCSATTTACRCEFAKVLTIKSRDFSMNYQEAFAFVEEEFVYRVGEMVYADGFNPNRWAESTGGIHFYLTREEADQYMGTNI